MHVSVCAYNFFRSDYSLGILGLFLQHLVEASKLLLDKPCILEQTLLNKSCSQFLIMG